MLDHGQIDMVCERKNLRHTLSRIISYTGPHAGTSGILAPVPLPELERDTDAAEEITHELTEVGNGKTPHVRVPARAKKRKRRSGA